jgi:hypothetical protein
MGIPVGGRVLDCPRHHLLPTGVSKMQGRRRLHAFDCLMFHLTPPASFRAAFLSRRNRNQRESKRILPRRRNNLPFSRRRKPTSILFEVVPICGLMRHLDAHHLRSRLALELQRLALGRIKVRSLVGFDGDRHAGGRQTVHLVVVDHFG